MVKTQNFPNYFTIDNSETPILLDGDYPQVKNYSDLYISSFKLGFKHPMAIWDMKKNDIHELITKAFPGFSRARNKKFWGSVLIQQKRLRRAILSIRSIIVMSLIVFIYLSFTDSTPPFRSVRAQLFLFYAIIFFEPVFLSLLITKSTSVNSNYNQSILQPFENSVIQDYFQNPVLESYTICAMILVIFRTIEPFAIITLSSWILIIIVGVFIKNRNFYLNNLFPIKIKFYDDDIVLLLSPSRFNHINCIKKNGVSYMVYSTKSFEDIFYSIDKQDGFLIFNFHKRFIETFKRSNNFVLQMKYLIFPTIIGFFLLFLVNLSDLMDLVGAGYVTTLLIIILVEVEFLLIGQVRRRNHLNNDYQTIKYTLENQLLSINLLESVVNRSISNNNAIPKENKNFNNGQYWSSRSGVPSTDASEKHFNDVLDLFEK